MWPNHSLERAGSAPRAVPAVPLIGCPPDTSTNGRVAAAQFNRQAPTDEIFAYGIFAHDYF